MNKDELLERLAAFGVEGNEAQAYYHLSRLGPTKAGDLAKEADLSRTDVYRVMESLEERGFVERTVDQPVRFVPVPVEDALARVIDARRREAHALEEERQALAASWPRPGERAEVEEARLSIHRDRSQIRGLVERLVGDARDEVLVICMKRSLARFESMELLERIRERAQEGVSVRILTEVDDTNVGTARRFAEDAELRHVDLPAYYQVVLSDARRAALFVAVDPLTSTSEGATTALHLTAQDFLLAQKALFDMLWSHGIEIEARAEELESGSPAGRVEVVRGRWVRFERIEEMLYHAEDEVALALTAGDVPRFDEAGLPRVLRRRADDGVTVRVITEATLEGDLEGAQVRKGTPPRERVQVLVDGRERLTVQGGGQASTGTADPDEWSVWSTIPADVSQALAAFERAWDEAA